MDGFLNSITEFEKIFNLYTVLLRTVLAVLFGGIIGLERGKHGRQAGMRTHILVCIGGAMTALIGVYRYWVLGLDSDPVRISAQVVSGIGFLGAGMIIVKSDRMITGLTTAAIMWATAIIGIAVGLGFYSGALIATFACFFTAAVLTRVDRRRKTSTRVYIEVNRLEKLEEVVEYIRKALPDEAFVETSAPKSGTAGNMGITVITTDMENYDVFKQGVKGTGAVHFMTRD